MWPRAAASTESTPASLRHSPCAWAKTPGGLCAGRDDTYLADAVQSHPAAQRQGRRTYPKPDAPHLLWLRGGPSRAGCGCQRSTRACSGAKARHGIAGRGLTEDDRPARRCQARPRRASRDPVPYGARLSGELPFRSRCIGERFGIGGIEGLLPGNGTLYVGGARGLARLSGGTVRTLDAARYPWLASINGLAQTKAGETWTIGDSGIVRMSTRRPRSRL